MEAAKFVDDDGNNDDGDDDKEMPDHDDLNRRHVIKPRRVLRLEFRPQPQRSTPHQCLPLE